MTTFSTRPHYSEHYTVFLETGSETTLLEIIASGGTFSPCIDHVWSGDNEVTLGNAVDKGLRYMGVPAKETILLTRQVTDALIKAKLD